jgi:hypothetical protein
MIGNSACRLKGRGDWEFLTAIKGQIPLTLFLLYSFCKDGFSDPKFARLLDCYSVDLWCTIFILCTIFARRYYKLCHIPGPFIASFTNFWRASIQYSGDFPDRLVALHNKYGPLVRVGPNTISVNDPGSLSTVYSSHGEFQKVRRVTNAHGH